MGTQTARTVMTDTVTDTFVSCMWHEIHDRPTDDNGRDYTGEDWKKIHISVRNLSEKLACPDDALTNYVL